QGAARPAGRRHADRLWRRWPGRRVRRGRRAAALRPVDPGPRPAAREQPGAGSGKRIHRPRRGHSPQPRTDGDHPRPGIADAVLPARWLPHRDGLAPLAPLAAPCAPRPGCGPRPARVDRGLDAGRCIRCAVDAARAGAGHRTHHHAHRAAVGASARPGRPARRPQSTAGAARTGGALLRPRRHGAPARHSRQPRHAGCLPRFTDARRAAGTGRDERRRLPGRPRDPRARPHRHRQPARRIQPRPRLLYRSHARPDGQGAGRLPPPPDPEKRRALHHAGTEGLRRQGPVGAGQGAGARKAAVRAVDYRPGAAHRRAAGHRPGAGADRYAGGPDAPRAGQQLVRAAIGRGPVPVDRRRPPPGRRKPDRALHRQRLQTQSRPAPVIDYWPEHGR
ncbi:unnamed protein product, partial [Rhizophagus irregularis]